jgi:hypothetical protein
MNGLLLTLVLLKGCDMGSTAIGLSHGARELILPQHLGANLSMQAGITFGEVQGLKALARRHSKWAKPLAIAVIVVEAVAVGQNVRAIQQQRQR